ncbi:hypothetical protein RRG08_065624 [Elysia crispata]|uniref:Uncharacterized protein n=1 Tax=Elysia crispata TaxID=231223 RepID=A0AAE1D1F9_9GAST|nr:hypothetical protein RRG08_065624 [Elysia crispata]
MAPTATKQFVLIGWNVEPRWKPRVTQHTTSSSVFCQTSVRRKPGVFQRPESLDLLVSRSSGDGEDWTLQEERGTRQLSRAAGWGADQFKSQLVRKTDTKMLNLKTTGSTSRLTQISSGEKTDTKMLNLKTTGSTSRLNQISAGEKNRYKDA